MSLGDYVLSPSQWHHTQSLGSLETPCDRHLIHTTFVWFSMRNSGTKLSIAGFVTCCVPEINFQVVAQASVNPFDVNHRQSLWKFVTLRSFQDFSSVGNTSTFAAEFAAANGGTYPDYLLASCTAAGIVLEQSIKKAHQHLETAEESAFAARTGHKRPRSKFPHRFGKLMAPFRRWPWEALAYPAPQASHVQVPCIQLTRTKRWTKICRMWLKDDWHDVFMYYKTMQTIEADNLMCI